MTDSRQSADRPTILCVDDEPYVLSALRRVLERDGCRVLSVTEGEEALRLLEQEEVHVLICDEAMPHMRGTEVLQRAKDVSPGTTRVLLTAHWCDEDVVFPAVNEGEIFRLLAKPWEDDAVRKIVAEALGLNPQDWAQRHDRVRARLRGEPLTSRTGQARESHRDSGEVKGKRTDSTCSG